MNPIDEKYYDHQQGPIRFPYFPKPQIAENKSEINGNLQPKVTDLAEPIVYFVLEYYAIMLLNYYIIEYGHYIRFYLLPIFRQKTTSLLPRSAVALSMHTRCRNSQPTELCPIRLNSVKGSWLAYVVEYVAIYGVYFLPNPPFWTIQ